MSILCNLFEVCYAGIMIEYVCVCVSCVQFIKAVKEKAIKDTIFIVV